jgi:hypothetical protein
MGSFAPGKKIKSFVDPEIYTEMEGKITKTTMGSGVVAGCLSLIFPNF